MNDNFIAKANDILAETEAWKKSWKHKKPCNKWKENEKVHGSGFCKHYADARYRRFKNKIVPLFEM